MIHMIPKRCIYNIHIPTYLGFSYKNIKRIKKIKQTNSSVYKLLNKMKMNMPKNYKTQYETRDFNYKNK